MYKVAKLKRLHPWIHVGIIVYAGDALGIEEDGQTHPLDEDSVVTGIVPEPWGALVGYKRTTIFRAPGPAT